MRKITNKIVTFFAAKNEKGVTALEYGLLAALVALVLIGGATLLGTNLNGNFTYVAGKVAAPSTAP